MQKYIHIEMHRRGKDAILKKVPPPVRQHMIEMDLTRQALLQEE